MSVSILNSSAYAAVVHAIDKINRDLMEADIKEVNPKPTVRDRAAKIKAWAYVWLAAAMEQYVKAFLRDVLSEIAKQAVPKRDLRVTLFSLECGAILDSLQEIRGLKMWEKRTDLLFELIDHKPAQFDSNALPLDGRTLRPDHFAMIWRVFGFDGASMPSLRHQSALNDLAEGRNDVAHGEVDPVTFGRQKPYPDLIRLVQQIQDIADHLALTADAYLSSEKYRR